MAYKPGNLEDGMPIVWGEPNGAVLFQSARLIFDSKDEPRGVEGKEQVLTSCDVSSLMADSMWAVVATFRSCEGVAGYLFRKAYMHTAWIDALRGC